MYTLMSYLTRDQFLVKKKKKHLNMCIIVIGNALYKHYFPVLDSRMLRNCVQSQMRK